VSVSRLCIVCNVCIVTKRYVLSRNCLKKQIWLPSRYLRYKFGPPTTPPPFPPNGVLIASPNARIANCGQTASVSGNAASLLLTAYRNLPTSYPTVPSPTPYGHLFSPKFARQLFGGIAPSLRYIATYVSD